MDRLFLLKFYEKIGKFPSVLITFFITNISWVFFRTSSIGKAVDYFKLMFSNQKLSCNFELLEQLNVDNRLLFTILIALFFSFIKLFKISNKLENFIYNNQKTIKMQFVQFILFSILAILSVGEFVSADFQPFIYSNF